MLVIRTPLGLGKYVLITGINYTVDDNRFPEDGSCIRNVLISGVLITGICCTCK